MRRKFVAANWKMHGNLKANLQLLSGIKDGAAALACDVALCVPFPYLAQVQSELNGTDLAWGAQNLSEHAQGAFTGEVSAVMLGDFSCRYVIVGHSERRALYGEDDRVVAAKFAAAQAGGLVPILCVGETLEEREAGSASAVIAGQLDAVIARVGIGALFGAVLAYEPVWAIGTGRTATPQLAQEVHGMIRTHLAERDSGVAENVRIVYGGSVKPENASSLFGQPDIDGGLIGGASLILEDFMSICLAAS